MEIFESMPVPKILGFPIYKNLKKRIGEKHSKSYWKKYSKEIYTKFNNYKQGDILQTCSGLNEKIIEIEPIYYPVGNGFILIDFDIKFSRTFCSFRNCGVWHPLSKEGAEEYRNNVLKECEVDDRWNFSIGYGREVMIIHEDGTFSVNEDKRKELLKRMGKD